MSTLLYNGHSHTIEMFDHSGNAKGRWPAYNHIDHAFAKAHYDSLAHLNDGTYMIQDKHYPHHHAANANGPYGLHGIIRFHYPGHPGVGVHAGRAHAAHMPGAQHATHGCIRTTDDAMAAIMRVMAKDAMTSITIRANNEHSVKHGMAKHQGLHP